MPPKKSSKSEADSDSSNEKKLKEIGRININIDELSQDLRDLRVNNNRLFGAYGEARIFAPAESNKRGPPTLSSLSSNDNMSNVGTPTKMVQFIPDFVLNEISPIIDKIFDFSQVYTTNIEIPSVIQTNYGYEDVSDLNGIAIPSFFYC